jgi:hypothetical protein
VLLLTPVLPRRADTTAVIRTALQASAREIGYRRIATQLGDRVAAIDVGKKIVAVAVRRPDERAGKRRQEVRKFSTYCRTLTEMVVCWSTRVLRMWMPQNPPHQDHPRTTASSPIATFRKHQPTEQLQTNARRSLVFQSERRLLFGQRRH